MNCSFCGKEITPGTGSVLVRRDGKLNRYCSNKCRKNQLLGRKPSKLKWIIKSKKSKGDKK